MPRRINLVLVRLVTPVLRLASWTYRHDAPVIDLMMAGLALSWSGLMVLRPEKFDEGSFLGMAWLPDQIWIAVTLCLATAHLVGLFRLDWRNWRMSAALGSSWMWLCVSASFLRVDISTGVFAYSIFGTLALLGAIYVGVLPRRVR